MAVQLFCSFFRREVSEVAGHSYIVSLRDGCRLRYNGSAVDPAPPGTAGSGLEWRTVTVASWQPAAFNAVSEIPDGTVFPQLRSFLLFLQLGVGAGVGPGYPSLCPAPCRRVPFCIRGSAF